MTSISLPNVQQDHAETPFVPAAPHIVVQILSVLLFGGFAIVATVLAFVAFWPAGFALAVILAWYGFSPPQNQHSMKQRMGRIKPAPAKLQNKPSGNTSFDAYRAEVMKRLEDEQKTFVSFLDRLRDAKDKSEFDTFVVDRAKSNLQDRPEGPKAGEY